MSQSKQRKILYILTKSDLGGVSKYLLEITKGLDKNITPYYIMSSEGYFSEELKKLGIKDEQIFFVPMTNSIFDLKTHITSNLATLKIIKKIKPDLIHCNSMTGGIVGRVCGVLSNLPVIFTAHGWTFSGGYSQGKLFFYKVLENLLALMTNKIICVSEHDLLIGKKYLPLFKDKMLMIHNGISDISEEHRKQVFSKDTLRVVMVTRFAWPKNPNDLIVAVNELNKEGLNIELDLYGYGNKQAEVEKLIKECNCSNIKMKGIAKNPELILKDYDLYALISDKEGLPIGIIEAMRAGLPVLVSNVGGCAELVQNNGYLVEKRSVKDLKSKLKSLYENLTTLPQLGQNSRALYEKEFIAAKMVKETIRSLA